MKNSLNSGRDNLIHELFIDYLSGDITEEGREQLDEWLKNGGDVEELRRDILTRTLIENAFLWDKIEARDVWETIQLKLHQKRVQRRYRWYGVAASVAVLMVSMVLFFVNRDDKTISNDELLSISELTPTFRTTDGKIISLLELSSTMSLSDNSSLRKSGDTLYYYKNSTDFGGVKNKISSDSHFPQIAIPRGCEFYLILPDGTQVWLNAETTLDISDDYNIDRREVRLLGEAYFDVVPNQDVPFIVNTDVMEISVLGTSFVVSAYPDNNELVTSLLTGRVRQAFENSGDTLILTPDMESVYSRKDGKSTLGKVDPEERLAWMNGLIVAKEKRLEDIFKQMMRWYDFKVVWLDSSLKDQIFHLNIKRYEDLEDVLQILQTTRGVSFIYDNNTLYVK